VQGEYGTLAVTEASAAVLDGSRRVKLRKEPERSSRSAKKSKVASDLPAQSVDLFEALRAWRSSEAKAQEVPAYIIFGDATLRGIAISRPGSLAELGGISGVGENKLAKYGEALLEVVAAN
jgi:ATP-dependent DNA helicase RecQ